jgi:Protein of unknown function (DUF2752)
MRMWFTAPASCTKACARRRELDGGMTTRNPGSTRARAAGPGQPAGPWRPGSSVPEGLGVAGLAAAGAAVAYQALAGGQGLWLPCPLRAVTGIPCPLCGMTTAATALAAGDLGAAMAANPFVLLVAAFTLVMVALMTARALGLAAPPAQSPAARRRQGYWVVGVLAAASWAFQLHRFGWV